MLIIAPVSVGELFDKISILEIKKEKIKEPNKLIYVQEELNILVKKLDSNYLKSFLENPLYIELKHINNLFWDICDMRREMETQQKFKSEYIEKSRQEYMLNDKRTNIKHEINKFFDSDIVEVKEYDINIPK